MNITEKDVQLLELAYYFINNCHYKFVSSRSAQNEIWLGNPQHPQYPVIRLSQTRLSTVFFDKQRILQIHQAIRNLFRRNCDLLDIHLSDEAVEEKEEQMAIVTITPQSISCPSLLALFPGMDQAVHPIEDPHQEYRRISDKLEELQRQKKREVRKIRQSMQPKATLVLMAICTAVYLLSLFLTWRYRSWAGAGEVNTAVGIFLGAYYKAFVVAANEYWRFLTCGLVPLSFWHLLVNMMSLYNLGMICEKFMGVRNYLITLAVSITWGSVFVFLGQGNTVTVGISGGLYGLMAAVLVYGFQTKIIFQPQIRTQFLLILLVNLMISLMPNVSFLAHLGGFVGGLLTAIIMTRNESWKQLRRNTAAALCAAVAFLIFQMAQPQARQLDLVYPGTDRMVAQMAEEAGLGFYGDHLLERTMQTYYQTEV